MSKSYIWLIDQALSSATTPGQSEAGSDGNEEVGTPHSPKAPELLKPHHQIV